MRKTFLRVTIRSKLTGDLEKPFLCDSFTIDGEMLVLSNMDDIHGIRVRYCTRYYTIDSVREVSV